jgi:PAS domain S-box-containing protein
MLNFLRKLFRRPPANPDEELRRVEEHFNQLVSGVSDYAIFLLDATGCVASWNTGAERIKGYRAEEIIGQHFSRFYPPEVAASGLPAHELEVASATGRFEDEGWRVRKDGSQFWANVVITALKNKAGAVRGFLKITRDMTERKLGEENARRLLQEETARRTAEASTKEAERLQRDERRQREQLHVTLSSIGDAVIVTDTQGLVTFMNPVAHALTGWRPEEAAGQPVGHVFPIINEETRLPVENPVGRVLREGVVVGLANHTLLIAREGRELPIDDSAAPIRGEDGTVAGVVLVFRDVSEVRRAVEARLHLAAIVESSDDAIISKDLEGTIVSWNKGAERLYGYKAAEIVGKPLALLVPAEHPNELPGLMERLRRGERIEHFETVRVRKDGTRVNVSLTISPVKNAAGKFIGASKIARDITDRKRHEESLSFLARVSVLLAELGDVPSTLHKVAGLAVPQFADWCTVDLLNPDGSLHRVAVAHADPARVEQARELTRRYPPDPNAPAGVWRVLRTGKPELIPEITDALLEQAIKDPQRLRVLKDLGLRSYLAVPLAIQGKTCGVLTFLLAASGRRFGSDDLRVAEDLAHRASVAIENAQLYSELKETGQRKDEFLAMLAHELRNPLAPIRNALQVMKIPGADAEMLAQARDMTERQVQHMVRLVDDLLDVSRIMRGMIQLRRESLDLASVISQAVETAQPMIDAQGQSLIVNAPPEALRLEADPTRLAQVIGNLLHNAAKFSERAGRIWLIAERNGNEAVIRIRDEGAGISGELLPHVFDLFVQGDRTLERSQGGLGIGLTVVRKLVELHGGRVDVHSEGLGKGSEFTICLPGLRDALPGESPGTDLQPVRRQASRRVLVVDDNVDAAESLATLMRLEGHEVRVAHNGPEALRVAEEHHPEAVLLDIGLPGMNGYEVARSLRQQEHSRQATLVAVTGYGQEEDRRLSREAGFNYHLTKPVDLTVLQQLLALPDGAN